VCWDVCAEGNLLQILSDGTVCDDAALRNRDWKVVGLSLDGQCPPTHKPVRPKARVVAWWQKFDHNQCSHDMLLCMQAHAPHSFCIGLTRSHHAHLSVLHDDVHGTVPVLSSGKSHPSLNQRISAVFTPT
jgi:hypothetical protein